MCHKLYGISPSKMKRLKAMRDQSKRFRVAFTWETAGDFTFHDTLREAKAYIFKWIKSPSTLFDLESVQIYDQHDRDRRIKLISGDRLFRRYFRI
jgi:phage terminase large subunit-like protein